jgi:hypothetical protein
MSPEMQDLLDGFTPDEARAWAAQLVADEFRAAARGELQSIGWIESSDEAADLCEVLGIDREALVERLADRLSV